MSHPALPMLLDLLVISALWLGFGFAAGVVIWMGLVVRRFTLRKRRPVVGPGTPSSPVVEGEGAAATYPAMQRVQGGEWGSSAPARRESGGRELLSFPK